MSKLLINEQPLQVLPTLSKAIGLNGSIVLQQVHYWLENARKGKNKAKYKEGKYWVYNSYPKWKKSNFPFWSVATIKRIFLNLEDQGFLLSAQFSGNNRQKWYTIDYEKVDELEASLEIPSGQNEPMEQPKVTPSNSSKCTDASGQNDPMLNRNLTETTTETTTEIKRFTNDIKIEMVSALSQVTGMDENLTYGRLARDAKDLFKAGYSAADISTAFGKKSAWYKKHWKGRKGDKPTTGDIRALIKDLAHTEHCGRDAFRKYVDGEYSEFIES